MGAEKIVDLPVATDGDKSEKRKSAKRYRKLKVMQYEYNPKTNESLGFNATNIHNALAYLEHRLDRWAWIEHAKDVITEADIKDSVIDETYKYTSEDLGKPKGRHWHIILDLKNPTTISAIAKRFGVPENFVEVINGSTRTHDAFLDCVAYLTHEDDKQQAYGKHLYERDEVHLSDKNIWRAVVQQREREALRKGGLSADVRVVIDKVSRGQMTLRQAYLYDNVLFVENRSKLKAARQEYLKNAPTPPLRTNYYITGEGGAGKSLSAKVLARSLRPDIDKDEELYFTVGDGAVPFDGYDGQPIVIWDDWRASDLLSHYDRSLIWKLFAINPERIDINVKYGSTALLNTVNIVTSVQPYVEFMNGLADEYKDAKGMVYGGEDRRQAYRRFPFFIEVSKDSLLLARNRGLSADELTQVEPIMRMENTMLDLIRHQDQGRRVEVAEVLQMPLGLMMKEAQKYQGVEDGELAPLRAPRIFEDGE